MLRHAWITDSSGLVAQIKVPDRGFILGTPLKTYHFLASSVDEKNSWFQAIQNKIFGQKKLFGEVRDL